MSMMNRTFKAVNEQSPEDAAAPVLAQRSGGPGSSFLPSMRQYAGNWASALWAFAPGAEAKLNTIAHRPADNQVDQLLAMGYPPAVAEAKTQRN